MPTVTALNAVDDAVWRRGIDLVDLSEAVHPEPELVFARIVFRAAP
ncbi:hypothetical protein [Mycobacterium kyorinense]|nr:hypothetical protein [Mycobacterium kyorinense]